MRLSTGITLVVCIAALAGCGGGGGGGVSVTIFPQSAMLSLGETRAFTATVTGTADTAVTWGVREGAGGGTVTSAGVYTAPYTAGTYHVVATSVADPAKTAVAAVTVTDDLPPPPPPFYE